MAKVKASTSKRSEGALKTRSAQNSQSVQKRVAGVDKTTKEDSKEPRTLRSRTKRVDPPALQKTSATPSNGISLKTALKEIPTNKLRVNLKRMSTVENTKDSSFEQSNAPLKRSNRLRDRRMRNEATNVSDIPSSTAISIDVAEEKPKRNKLTLGKMKKEAPKSINKITAELTCRERSMLEKQMSPVAMKEQVLRVSTRKSARKNNVEILQPRVGPNRMNIQSLTTFPRKKVTEKEQDISRFEPSKNSTVCESPRHSEQKQSKAHSPKNLANKSKLIEQILFSDEEIENETNKESDEISKSAALPHAATVTKAQKFFHRDFVSAVNSNTNQTNKVATSLKKSNNKVKQRAAPQRRGSVYQFLSQSQSSDSEETKKKDPAADVIQRLIKQGRVRVATRRNGRHILKRLVYAAKKPGTQYKVQQTTNAKNKTKKQVNFANNNDDNAIVEHCSNDDDDFFHDDGDTADHHNANDESEQLGASSDGRKTAAKTNGTFSRLARSVLLQEMGRKGVAGNQLINQRRHLLEVARKFASTPVKKQQISTITNISPIVAPPPISKPTSPWRVNEDSYLPSVFHFSKNSSNLPSFSSDFIPSSPKKQKAASEKNSTIQSTLKEDAVIRPAIERDQTGEPSIQVPSINDLDRELSSFSSNDSNAENQPPPKPPASNAGTANADENEDIFNLHRQPNPRRAQSNRSPLKAINILEVVALPPWKQPPEKEYVNKNQSVASTSDNSDEASKDVSMFGFDELIDDEQVDPTQLEDSHDSTTKRDKSNLKNKSLHEKLHELRKWRPAVELCSTASKSPQKLPNIFGDEVGRPKRRGIKEMFCSTMINQQPSTSKQALVHIASDDDSSNEAASLREPKRDSASAADLLFADPDPELSFDSKNPHRTYLPPSRKKRKLRHHFVMFLDSDASEDEDESHEDRDEYNVSTETAKGPKRKRKKQRHAEEKSSAELDTFADEMNSVFKEVEDYELAVE